MGSCGSYRAVGAVGQRAPGLRAALAGKAVVVLHLLAQQILQALNVLDGVAQDLHLGQPLAGVGRGAAPQRVEGVVHLLQPPALAHCGGPPTVHKVGLALAGFAGPREAVARLVRGPGDPDVLVLLGAGQLGARAELRAVWRRGAHGVVVDLGWREDVHSLSKGGCRDGRDRGEERGGVRRERERRPLSDVRGLLPQAPLLCPEARAQGPHWSDLITMAHWPKQKAGLG